MISRLCHGHQGTYIDVYKTFYNKSRQLKVHFHQPRDNIHLSTSDTEGLLSAINAHTDIVDKIKTCAKMGAHCCTNLTNQGRSNTDQISL